MKTIACIIMAIFMFGCSVDEVTLRSYVMGYYDVEALSISANYLDNREYFPTPAVGGSAIIPVWFVKKSNVATYESVGNEKALYDQLCAKNNDVNYNRTFHKESMSSRPFVEYPAVNVVNVELVSDADFSESYPAGTPLNLSAWWFTPKEYIDAGYGENGDYYNTFKELPGLYFSGARNRNQYDGDSATDYRLMSLGVAVEEGRIPAFMILLGYPDAPNYEKNLQHTFTVRVKFEDGRVLTAQKFIDFSLIAPPNYNTPE